MKQRGILVAGLALMVLLLGASPRDTFDLADRWADPQFEKSRFKKFLVVGITSDQQARRRFEERFVSMLRGRYLDGVASYTLVPDLTHVDSEKALLQSLDELGIEAAISVRLVAMKDVDPATWAQHWRSWLEQDPHLDGLIEDTLPLSFEKAKRYGAEFALWEGKDWDMVWGARTDALSKKKLGKRSGSYVRGVMNALEFDNLLEPSRTPEDK